MDTGDGVGPLRIRVSMCLIGGFSIQVLVLSRNQGVLRNEPKVFSRKGCLGLGSFTHSLLRTSKHTRGRSA